MRALVAAIALVNAACVGTAGGELVTFEAFAAGPEDAGGGSLSFETGRGWSVTLDQATIHIGAVYMNESVPTSVASDTSCTLAGIYVAEVTTGLDVDALSPEPVRFPEAGRGTTTRARTGEIWLSGGDIDAEVDPTIVASVHGVARRPGGSFPFEGVITIGKNRVEPPSDPAAPGSSPICKQRVVTPIAIDIAPTEGGKLVVRADPRGWFTNVDFERLEAISLDPPSYRFRDDSSDQPSDNLYGGIRASGGVYSFAWEPR
jgi:hypothetical protein